VQEVLLEFFSLYHVVLAAVLQRLLAVVRVVVASVVMLPFHIQSFVSLWVGDPFYLQLFFYCLWRVGLEHSLLVNLMN